MTKEELQRENENKKEYLRSYQGLLKNIKLLQVEIDQLRISKMNPSVTYDDMPHPNNNTDLSTYAAVLDSKERQLADVKERALIRYGEIADKIENMSDATERSLLTLKYLRLLTFDEVAEKLDYSARNTIRKHGIALKHFMM
ncbi:hypothetical protein C8E03_11931 [Lachnotalea glycerini]|uniref:DUF1492 domain-containing protein n=1 Tax=Lachnotalea glycerini TaxID=1763509 RepID=A0A318EGM3_9FIRM|nr:hypothetical protein [Lachnotalea glycerini]PXV85107.1 hypothetical protein C8E03_11931 [Lachnotalea glycerini]